MTRRRRGTTEDELLRRFERRGRIDGEMASEMEMRRIEGRDGEPDAVQLVRRVRRPSLGTPGGQAAGRAVFRGTIPAREVQAAQRAPERRKPRLVPIAESWYEIRFDVATAGVRCMSPGRWGYYFRDRDGNAVGKQEYYTSSKAEAVRRVANVGRHLGWRLV